MLSQSRFDPLDLMSEEELIRQLQELNAANPSVANSSNKAPPGPPKAAGKRKKTPAGSPEPPGPPEAASRSSGKRQALASSPERSASGSPAPAQQKTHDRPRTLAKPAQKKRKVSAPEPAEPVVKPPCERCLRLQLDCVPVDTSTARVKRNTPCLPCREKKQKCSWLAEQDNERADPDSDGEIIQKTSRSRAKPRGRARQPTSSGARSSTAPLLPPAVVLSFAEEMGFMHSEILNRLSPLSRISSELGEVVRDIQLMREENRQVEKGQADLGDYLSRITSTLEARCDTSEEDDSVDDS